MTPKKIYIASHYSDALQMDKDLWVESDIANHNTGYCSVPYILESEHNKQIEELKAENEKLKMQLHRYLDESSAKTWTSPHDATLTSINHNGKSYPIYADLKEGHTYMTDIVDGKATIIDITQNL